MYSRVFYYELAAFLSEIPKIYIIFHSLRFLSILMSIFSLYSLDKVNVVKLILASSNTSKL